MKLKHIFFLGVCALLCASCEDENNTSGTPESITFVSEANEFATRTTQEGNQWIAGDQIGVYMLESGTHTPVVGSSHTPYTAQADGASATFSSQKPFTYPEDGAKVDFIGYYPYHAEAGNLVYPISLANQSAGSGAHDLMRATSRTGYSQDSSPEVSLSFSHQLSKTVFQFKDTQGETVYPEGLTIQGMNTTASFDLATGTLSNAASATTITPYKASNGIFEAIVLPAEIAATHSVEYTLNGSSYSWNLTDTENIKLNAIEAGYKYTFTITVADEGPVAGKVEVDGGSLAPWGNGEPGEGTAEMTVNYTLYPANEATDVHADTYLTLTFTGEAPEVGTIGSIRVYRADDDVLVDEIQMGDTHSKLDNNSLLHTKMDILWAGDAIERYRTSNYHPVTVEGHTATIKLHFNKLDYNTKYYVLIDSRVIRHKDFVGVKKPSAWTFTTKEKPAAPTDAAHTVTVGHDPATADFRTVQAALNFLVNTVDKDGQKTVYIHNGIYEELIFLRDVNNVTIKGESREGVIIRYKNYDNLNGGVGGSASNFPEMGGSISYSGGRSVVLIETVNQLRFESLTLENTYGRGNQAEAIYANNDNNALMFVNCTIKSCQDTLNLKGFCWFYKCLIAGDVDFIWGGPSAALFESCEIRSVGDGYVVQARVAQGNKGFVFLDCDLTTTGDVNSICLARTGGSETYDNVTFANCRMHEIYHTSGWKDTTPLVLGLENGYKMYNCTDPSGARVAHEVFNNSELAYELNQEEYEAHFSSRSIVLSAYNRGDLSWFAE